MDHTGFAVRDLDEAVRFFVDVLGADLVFQAGPVLGLESKEEAEPGTSVRIAFMRFGPQANIELLEFDGPRHDRLPPRVSDTGAGHIALWVDDIEAASAYLASQPGVTILGKVGLPSDGPDLGSEWLYVKTPFGLCVELVHRPPHMPYEERSVARLYGPAKSWSVA